MVKLEKWRKNKLNIVIILEYIYIWIPEEKILHSQLVIPLSPLHESYFNLLAWQRYSCSLYPFILGGELFTLLNRVSRECCPYMANEIYKHEMQKSNCRPLHCFHEYNYQQNEVRIKIRNLSILYILVRSTLLYNLNPKSKTRLCITLFKF